ncbi:MAG: ATP-dependent DNA helicase [Ferrovum sp.]|nr:ATP-dependent DNA helicase [Ferrovum sp.]NDU87151.1 ATP-dependent DNA helicase [Ferrovum sp.]
MEVETYFSAQGALAQGLPDFRSRPSQVEMAQAVSQALQERSSLVVEAGTGTGKTFAYLVPALLSGGRIILSTGTKTLQDQLFKRDIPILRRLLKLPISVALLKGRANYLCQYHLDLTLRQGLLFDREEVAHLQQVAAFAQRTQTGDIAELAEVPEQATLWRKVTSTRENCLGQECQHYADCFVLAARKQALQADLVVINHHLFFADVLLRDEGAGELLPRSHGVIFDEAHQLPVIATHFFGRSLSTLSVMEMIRALKELLPTLEIEKDALLQEALKLEQTLAPLRASLSLHEGRLSLDQVRQEPTFAASWQIFAQQLEKFYQFLGVHGERAEALQEISLLAQEFWNQAHIWEAEEKQEVVRWVECFPQTLHFNATPLSMGEILGAQWQDPERAWIFTSATLSVRGDFSHFQEAMGLAQARTLCWDSPFDYPRQALLYVPRDLPLPQMREHTTALMSCARPLLEASQGRAFLLFTTHRALQEAERILLSWKKEGHWAFPLLVQGTRSRNDLLEQFRHKKHAVLLGTASFWEGVDIKGEALSVVIIDKLPFAPPDDPVEAARIQAMTRSGRNGFMEYQLPRAILLLKQGAGRLIRDEQDRGVLMIGDRRLLEKSYGSRIWRSLPPMTRTTEGSVAAEFFTRCAKSPVVQGGDE